MPILGPNCYGVINYLDGALLWPDQHGGIRVDRGVALISQSSNIVINLGMQKRALPVAYVACLGNAAVVGLAELAGALLDDPRVTALGLYIEGIDDADVERIRAAAVAQRDRQAAGLPAGQRGAVRPGRVRHRGRRDDAHAVGAGRGQQGKGERVMRGPGTRLFPVRAAIPLADRPMVASDEGLT